MIQTQKILERDTPSHVILIASTYNPLRPSISQNRTINTINFNTAESPTTEKLHQVIFQNSDFRNAERFNEYKMTSEEKLRQVLRKNSDCRIVKQFKEYDICLTETGQELSKPKLFNTEKLSQWLCNKPKNCVRNSVRTVQNLAMGECTMSHLSANHDSNFESCKNFQYDKPLRLYGGGPGEDDNKDKAVAPISANHFDKVLAAYQKAIDPRRQKAFLESGAPSYSIKLFDGSDDTLDGGKSTCGTGRCPSGRLSFRFDGELPNKPQTEKSCGLSGCPYIKSKMDSESAAQEKIAELEALERSAKKIKAGSKCPANMLPPIPPLKTIHWDCPDPLPDGPCQNPQCPLRPKQCKEIPRPTGTCGVVKCPYSVAVLCGDKCPNNPVELLPYTPPPPPPPPPCPPPPCPPPPCYYPPPCPPPPCYYPPPCPPPPCYYPPPPPSCANPRCPHSPPPCPPPPPSCANPRCPHSPPPCPPPPCPPPPSCANPRCPHSPPPCPPPPCPPPPSCANPRCPHSRF